MMVQKSSKPMSPVLPTSYLLNFSFKTLVATLQLIFCMNFFSSWWHIYNTLFSWQLMNGTNKLQCLLLTELSVRCNVTLYLTELIFKIRRKWSVVNTVPSAVFTPPYFLSQLTSETSKLECLFLASFSQPLLMFVSIAGDYNKVEHLKGAHSGPAPILGRLRPYAQTLD